MIRWCAYCQHYQGLVEPRDSFVITHVLCPECRAAGAIHVPDLRERLAPVIGLHNELRQAGRAGDIAAASAALDRGLALGLRPRDMLVGLVQPSLWEIGELWARGEVTVAQEHRFTGVVTALLDLMFARTPELRPLRQVERPRVLLVNADGNYHVVGLRLLEFVLLLHGVPCFTVLPGLPARETADLALALRAPFVGVSVALPEQLDAAREVADRLDTAAAAARPRLLLGGYLFASGNPPPDDRDWIVCRDEEDALAVLRPA